MTGQGQEVEVPIFKVVRAYQPNRMGLLDKMLTYLHKLCEYVIYQVKGKDIRHISLDQVQKDLKG